MTKILFLIHDLGIGGAEKVLVNLVNHMDQTIFDITVISLFGGGVNEQFLASHIHYRVMWRKTIPGNSKLMKLLTPCQLHRLCVKEHYDVEVAYLEGPAARIISGCEEPDTKLFCWIHSEQPTSVASDSFRSYAEAQSCYSRFDNLVFVSEGIRKTFANTFPSIQKTVVCYNTIDTDRILSMKDELVEDVLFSPYEIKLVSVGKISKSKGVDRLARVVKRLRDDGLPVHLYALGNGPDQAEIETYLQKNRLEEFFTFLGYQTNPYKYVAHCDLFVCASLTEGFSTAATEALVVGVPICTVEVSGMKELLGEHNEWGIVTENNEDALYMGIKRLLDNPNQLLHFREKAKERRKRYSMNNTIKVVENLLSEGSI